MCYYQSVSPKNITSIHFIPDIVKTCIIAISNNSLALALEKFQIIYNPASKKSAPIFQCRLINYYNCTFSLHTFHDPLDTALPKIITMAFHCKTKNTYCTLPFFIRIIITPVIIIVISCLMQDSIGNKILTCTIAFHYCLNQIFWNMLIISQKLFGILW